MCTIYESFMEKLLTKSLFAHLQMFFMILKEIRMKKLLPIFLIMFSLFVITPGYCGDWMDDSFNSKDPYSPYEKNPQSDSYNRTDSYSNSAYGHNGNDDGQNPFTHDGTYGSNQNDGRNDNSGYTYDAQRSEAHRRETSGLNIGSGKSGLQIPGSGKSGLQIPGN